ncbi:MAG: hypothetical protein H7A01_18165 [Hahellaceae bacterium]|nr:hypothetical protein [Hahellaceae bacterium]
MTYLSSTKFSSAFVLLLLSLLTGCASVNGSDQPPLPENLVTCKDPRPEMCTMIYDPVCAYDQQGQGTTASSDCQACGNQNTIGFVKGACGDGQGNKTTESPSLNY